jgi:hypothetical protein
LLTALVVLLALALALLTLVGGDIEVEFTGADEDEEEDRKGSKEYFFAATFFFGNDTSSRGGKLYMIMKRHRVLFLAINFSTFVMNGFFILLKCKYFCILDMNDIKNMQGKM